MSYLRYVVAVPLVFHGLANLAGLFAPWTGGAGQDFSGRPWIFSSGVTLPSPVGRAWSLLWLVSTIFLVGAGIGVIAHQQWWRALAIAGCAVSLVSIVPWWNTVPPGARFGAIFDVIVIAVLVSPLGARIAAAV